MSFDLLLNSLNLFLKEMYGDQCRELILYVDIGAKQI